MNLLSSMLANLTQPVTKTVKRKRPPRTRPDSDYIPWHPNCLKHELTYGPLMRGKGPMSIRQVAAHFPDKTKNCVARTLQDTLKRKGFVSESVVMHGRQRELRYEWIGE